MAEMVDQSTVLKSLREAMHDLFATKADDGKPVQARLEGLVADSIRQLTKREVTTKVKVITDSDKTGLLEVSVVVTNSSSFVV